MVTQLHAEGAGTYLDWGVVHISIANLLIILAMIVVFVLALVLPFPHGRGGDSTSDVTSSDKEQRP